MNQSIFLFVNNFAGRWGWLDSLMVFCAEYLIYVMVLVVLGYVILDYKKLLARRSFSEGGRNMALVAIGSAIIARFIVASGIRYFYYHARPYLVISETNLLLVHENVSSFPSGHTIFVFALATGVYRYNKKIGKLFYVLAGLVGFSRIFVGVHWPYDILVGAGLGVLVALVCDWLFKKYKYVVGL